MRPVSSLIAAAALLTGPLTAHAANSVGDCHIGAYRFADGAVVDLAPTGGADLRWRRFDGATGALRKGADGTWTSLYGWTERPDGKAVALADCAKGEIRFDGRTGRRIAFDVTDVPFHSRDVDLAGRLVLPKGKARVPVVVLVHGSESDSAREFYALQRMLPAQGVGVFVYDKRGTGDSGGKYTQDYDLLADDIVAAMREARRVAGPRAGRVGYQGGSQAGWTVPMAVNRAPVDFAIISFGLAVSPIDEDQEEVALEMAHYGPEVVAKAQEIAAAAEAVLESRFTSGFKEFDAVRAKYRAEPWYKDVRGNATRFLMPYDEAQLKEQGKQFNFGTPWRYDPMPTLRADTKVPQLWIVGADDLDAPSAETGRRIKALGAEGKPFTLAVFPGAEHGMTEYETNAAGERVSTRFAAGYFAMMRDFARDGRLQGPYGAGVVTGPGRQG